MNENTKILHMHANHLIGASGEGVHVAYARRDFVSNLAGFFREGT